VSRRVALATCAEFPRLTEDDPLLLPALRERGVTAEPAVWDDPAIDWAGFDLVVIRSTWDYSPRREEFVSWARRVPRLLNSAEIVVWNTDKTYLSQLEYSVPTQFVRPGQEFAPPGGEYVVKPAISAGSRHTARYEESEAHAATEHANWLLASGRTVMVQPYLGQVDSHGETALIYFGGSYSHAIRKGQMLQRGAGVSELIYLPEAISPREPSPAERQVADHTLDALPWPREQLLYARVDLIPDPDGEPKVVELELTEPSLFLSFGERAAERLAAEIVRRI
jgi:glutathione synthase/RimK-type ligase-like ATP-grasp enzyme